MSSEVRQRHKEAGMEQEEKEKDPKKKSNSKDAVEEESLHQTNVEKAEKEEKVKENPTLVSKGFLFRALLGMVLALVVAWRQDQVKSFLGKPLVQPTKPEWSEKVSSQEHLQDDEDYGYEDSEEEYYGETEGGEDASEESVTVNFVNEWRGPVSLWWESSEDEWVMVQESFRDTIAMNSFVGHRFMFTREGTRDQVGDEVVVEKGQSTYVLPANAKRKAEEDPCADRYPKKCPRYAQQGECTNNPGWMIVHCPTSCNACELLDPKKRCDRKFLNMTEEHVWQPGDLNKMFERIIEEYSEDLKITVVSQPPEGPWILTFDDFLDDDEVNAFLKWGAQLGYERSSDVGDTNERGETTKVVSQSRTSSNTWCTRECEKDPLVKQVTMRTEEITGIPMENYESFQLLEYKIGQYYKGHHDMSNAARREPAGPRILTFFLYLSDVEEGGETEFPRALGGIKVQPKRGRAVLWPSVLDQDPLQQDPRTFHAALPVKKGKKYASNHWIHSHNFRIPNLWGCSGSFS